VISSILFALAHVTHGLLWPKLLVYFLAGVVFAVTAYLSNSILPSIPVHIIGDPAFFALVWPHDAARSLVQESGPDAWFWIHLVQAIVFSTLVIVAFVRPAKASKHLSSARQKAASGMV
jgi:Type II CAAX prenyl endopeptidase Rce1-like